MQSHEGAEAIPASIRLLERRSGPPVDVRPTQQAARIGVPARQICGSWSGCRGTTVAALRRIVGRFLAAAFVA
jgi:hypothetical protein